MRYVLIALVAAGAVVSTAAQARWWHHHHYYGYYGAPAYGAYDGPLGARVRVGPGDPGYQSWRPRFDPRNGGTYCVQAGFTVQDGVCKPGRPY